MLTPKTQRMITTKATEDIAPTPFNPGKNYGYPWVDWVAEIFEDTSSNFEDKYHNATIWYRGGKGLAVIYFYPNHIERGRLSHNMEVTYDLAISVSDSDIEDILTDAIEDVLGADESYLDSLNIEGSNSVYIMIKYSSEFKGDPNSKKDWQVAIENAVETYNSIVGGVYRAVDELYEINKVEEY